MKTPILLSMLLSGLTITAQNKIRYTYDESGNRIATSHVRKKEMPQEYKYMDMTLKVENNYVYVYFPNSLFGATFIAYDPAGNTICRYVMKQSPLCAGPMPMKSGIYFIKIQYGTRVIREFKIKI